MITISQKCQYALRAVFELAKRPPTAKPTTIGEIATIQAIPPRFLELILNQLKQGGYVASRRGVQGGYRLAVAPDKLTAGDIIRFIDGPIEPVKCVVAGGEACPLQGECNFIDMWKKAGKAMAGVFDSTSFSELLSNSHDHAATSYCI